MPHMKIMGRILLVLYLTVSGQGMPITAAAALAISQAPTDDVYYVSNDGDDDDDGSTPETAWQTIAHVNEQTFQPGDSVLFRRGDTWRETLYVASSGTPAAWITFGVYGTGDKPRILGSEQAIGWVQEPSHPNIWRSSTPLNNPYLSYYSNGEVYFEELDGTTSWGDQQDYNASFSNMTKEYDWSWNANTVYVYAPSNPGSRYAAVEVPQRDSGIRFPEVPYDAPVEYVAIDNLEIMYAMRHGIYPGYNEVEVHGLRITNNHIGFIGVKGGRSAYCIAAWHSDMLIQNNTIHDCGRRGVSLNTYTSHTPGLTISNITIDNNHFYNGFHTTSADISTIDAGHTFTNVTISNNLIDDTARWREGINAGCFASSCTSNSIYVESRGNAYSGFYIYNNIILGSTSRAILFRNNVDDIHVYHNTIYASHPGARPYSLVTFHNVSNVDLRNNIIYGTLSYAGGANDARCVLDTGAPTSSIFSIRDYNLYHQEDPDQPFTGSEDGFGGWDTFISEWDWWRAGSGFETHSPHPQLPLFVDQENGDFRLRVDSPAVDAGVLIPGFNDDYEGAAPDLGAIEFTPSMILHGTPADQAIDLTWSVNASLPATATWHIDYYTTATAILTATAPLSITRAYRLTGLTNYASYTVTVSAMVGESPIGTTALFSATVTAMPTDIFVYLPHVLREN